MSDVLTRELFGTLLAWYDENKRVLPWRGTTDPYRVWVSEIMLQQTRVETVKSYFSHWMRLFPTVRALAEASEDEVLKAWEGLGYYSRARNLHGAAKMVCEVYGGEIPRDRDKLRKLPGIGDYTVGAILSIAFGIAEPAVDGNVLRVISRLTADDADVSRPDVRKRVADILRPLMPAGRTSEFTQALFEIGALICLPNDAFRCDLCPLRAACRAYAAGTQTFYPVKPEKAEKRTEKKTVLILTADGEYAVRRRPAKGLLANLYEFPNLMGHLSEEEVRAVLGAKVVSVEPLPAATHVFTHLIWDMTGYLVRLAAPVTSDGIIWATKEEIGKTYSIPSAFRAYKKALTL